MWSLNGCWFVQCDHVGTLMMYPNVKQNSLSNTYQNKATSSQPRVHIVATSQSIIAAMNTSSGLTSKFGDPWTNFVANPNVPLSFETIPFVSKEQTQKDTGK